MLPRVIINYGAASRCPTTTTSLRARRRSRIATAAGFWMEGFIENQVFGVRGQFLSDYIGEIF